MRSNTYLIEMGKKIKVIRKSKSITLEALSKLSSIDVSIYAS